VQPNEITEVLNRPISQELLARDLTRLAYVAKDGTPRNVPMGFTWNGSEIVMTTAKNAPKLSALRNNPTVALTIDTEVHPPKGSPWFWKTVPAAAGPALAVAMSATIASAKMMRLNTLPATISCCRCCPIVFLLKGFGRERDFVSLPLCFT